ncbi:acyltransferase family protein [Mariniluteicoccus endophyticus]
MEIHGLRGLAIALVVVYHLWGVGRVSGGVDIFLMISAYLMTMSFVRQGEKFDTGNFLVKRFRQLIPQAALVILSTCVASLLILAPTRLPVVFDQAKASLLYYQNWALINLATDYNSPDRSGTSPLQHFWSLSMQGQVFIAWALIMGLAVFLARSMKINIRLTLGIVFGVLTLFSMTYALRQISSNPTGAYFNTFARIWEFSLASLLALAPTIRLPRPLATALGWGGLVAIITCGMTVGHEPFPGPAALVPSLGAAAIVMAGSDGGRGTAAYWLASSPLRFLGDRAYGLYLWHWPVYMLWMGATGVKQVGLLDGLAVIAISVALADVATRLVERRFNQWGALKSWQAGLITIVTVLTVALGVVFLLDKPVKDSGSGKPVSPPDTSGNALATPGVPVPPGSSTRNVAPGDTIVAQDWPPLQDCPMGVQPTPPFGAQCHEVPAQGQPRKTVVVIGDSHSRQWMSVIEPIAKDNNWRVLIWSRSSCRVATKGQWVDDGCVEYGRNTVDAIVRLKPDFVFSTATRAHANSSAEEIVEGYSEMMRPVLDAGIKVVNMRDNPRWSQQMPECVQQFGNDEGKCTRPVAEKLAPVSPLDMLDPRMAQMDLTEYFCPAGMCNGVIGNTYVYMDDNHLTKTYIKTLRRPFEEQLFAVVPR